MLVSVPERNRRLLLQLPGDLRVADCAECGLLLTSCWQAFRLHGKLGLRLIGRWRPDRTGHRRPYCRSCSLPRGTIPGPGEHRPLGQGESIWKELGKL